MPVFIAWMIIAPSTDIGIENRPPISEVPPMTTARIASSSSQRPGVVGVSAADVAGHDQPGDGGAEARRKYRRSAAALPPDSPAKRAADRLTPTASISRPSAVRRTIRVASDHQDKRRSPPASASPETTLCR